MAIRRSPATGGRLPRTRSRKQRHRRDCHARSQENSFVGALCKRALKPLSNRLEPALQREVRRQRIR